MIIMMVNEGKKFFLSTIVVFFSLLVYGQERPKMDRFLTIKPTSASFNAAGGSKTFTVSASGTWKISSSKGSWMHLSKNDNTLKVRVDENTGTSSRSGSFELTSGEKSVRVSVIQAGGEISLSVSSENVSFGSSGGTKTITVTTNGSWQIGTSTASWGHLTRNGNQLSIRIDRNSNTTSRTDWFTVKAGNKEKRINISQSASSTTSTNLTVSLENLQFDSSGGTKTITISSNGSWQIGTSTASWGHLTRNGNQLSIRIDRNSNTTSRTDWFTVKAGNKEKRINISQSGNSTTTANLIVSSDNLQFDSYGGTKSITISSDDSWQIGVRTASWGHLTKSGDKISIKIDRNANSTSRSDWFTVKAGNVEKKIRITQEGMQSSLSVSSEKLSFSSYGGSQTITVKSNKDWHVSVGTLPWGHLKKYGNSLYVSVNKNRKKTSRTDYFKLKAGDQEVKVDISQNGRYRSPFNHAVDNYIGGALYWLYTKAMGI